MMNRRRFVSLCAASAASPALAKAPLRWHGVALGANAFLELHGPEAQTRPALNAALSQIRLIERLFSLYKPDSFLSRLNRNKKANAIPPDVLELFALVDKVHRLTDGVFDPTIQPLWNAVALGGDVRNARTKIGWDKVVWSETGIWLESGQALTFNGIAQGFATDRVIQTLTAHGLTNIHANIGEHAVRGKSRRLAISDPVFQRVGTTTIKNQAVATSSPFATALGKDGHIVSPFGTKPHWSTVSVQAQSATLADGFSTALCLLPSHTARRITQNGHLQKVVLVDWNGDVVTIPARKSAQESPTNP